MKASFFTRRRLLAATAAVPLLAKVAPAVSGNPTLKVKEADVVIVGYGAAGASAAIEAADAGASVLILEKSPEASHCSTTRLSSGIYQCPDGVIDREILVDYICSTYLPDGAQLRKSSAMPSPLAQLARVWAELAPETFNWLRSLDPDFRTASSPLFTISPFVKFWHGIKPHIHARIATYAQWSGFSFSTYKKPKSQSLSGEALYNCLHHGILKRKIDILYSSPAKDLLVENGVVRGVIVERDGIEEVYTAKKGVILASGGFAFNKALRDRILPAGAGEFVACCGTPANTGDGISIGMKHHAAITRSHAFFDRFCVLLPEKIGGCRLGVPLEILGQPQTFVVDNAGNRFIAESELQDAHQHYGFLETMLTSDGTGSNYPFAPFWCIIDRTAMTQLSIATLGEGSTVNGLIDWKNNFDALQKNWVLEGKTIEDLARQIAAHPDNRNRMTPEALTRSFNALNRFAREKNDRDFDRSPASLAVFDGGPYYAFPVSIDVPHMAAGLATDHNRQVLDTSGRVIPNLFAAGEVAPVSHYIHDRGGQLSECLVFGRFVGQYVAQKTEKS